MDEGFELPVTFQSKELLFPARLIRFGYSYSIEVNVNGIRVSFEKDEERNWRAIVTKETESRTVIDLILLQSILDSLEAIG